MKTKILVLALLLGLCVAASAQTTYDIKWQVISAAGTEGTSTTYGLQGTVGQTAATVGSSAAYGLTQGYWALAAGTAPAYVCGDSNADGTANITDAVYLITYIFAGGPAPDPLAAGDTNCDGSANITDAVYLITYIFAGGPAPCDTNGDGTPDC
jgi:hypothetical protein